jgi:hydroxymethylpyrimidine/phosphomethylpyrimidine kinase
LANILVFSGFDPSGGAGVIRDALAINALGGNPFVIPTVNTAQNTQQVGGVYPIPASIIYQQFKYLVEDFDFHATKIGLIHPDNIEIIIKILKQLKLKVVLDPILMSSTSDNLGHKDAILELLPYTYLATPNYNELITLSNEKNIDLAIKKLNLPYLLLTMTDVSNKTITHKIYQQNQLIKEFNYQKLPNNYHGSGCSLAAMLSVDISGDIIKCCESALDKTYKSLQNGVQLGNNQYHPKL